MDFEERVKEMLTVVGHENGRHEILVFEKSAYNWYHDNANHYLNPLVEKLFENGFELSERREQEIRHTSDEMVVNSYRACGCSEDLRTVFQAYFGDRGIMVRLDDNGEGFDHEAEVRKARGNPNGLDDERVLYRSSDEGYPGGSGMYCLLNFADDFQYSEKGNSVAFRLDLQKES